MQKYNVNESIQNQKEYCATKGYSQVAPRDGICGNCGLQIYSVVYHEPNNFQKSFGMQGWVTGVSTEESKMLVIGCPHCRHSFIRLAPA